jgi:hypothetical protein
VEGKFLEVLHDGVLRRSRRTPEGSIMSLAV